MKKQTKKRGMEEDEIRLLTINRSTRKVKKHMFVAPGRIYIDLVRKRFHVPGVRAYTYKHLGVGWFDMAPLAVDEPRYMLYRNIIEDVSLASEIWGATFMEYIDKGNGNILIDIKNLTYYAGEGKWKKI